MSLRAPSEKLLPGQRIRHSEHGEGIIISPPANGFVRAFFPTGERQVPIASLTEALSRTERIIRHTAGGGDRKRLAWLCWKAHALPLMDNASALTSAKVDLLPHQVVLTHRVATASPRRFLIADEVGLGKTIETALILRELISRGELKRALMIVPAGLVNNWHRELNEVFNLNFEVFGSEGDVTDRKSNAFEKHNFLIASVDTLKLKARMARLKAAPPWDLVVFDEAHHLTASRQGGKVKKTLNYRLAEMLKQHTRDMVLLSATPHQGDHFRFWMLVQLLDSTLFSTADEMVEHRHRLNSVIFRRTKADACLPDGSTLFARRQVHTEAFEMSAAERAFYEALVAYLQEGFALAKRRGKKGQGLAFVMTIFQKIAASSFAAVRRTLTRRLIALTVQEGLMHDANLDIEQRNAALDEARNLIRESYALGDGRLANAEADKILADYKAKILRQQDDNLPEGADEFTSETGASEAEDAAIASVAVALPEERRLIRELLADFPPVLETKVEKLMGALEVLWKENPEERMVVFATYLGSVEMLGAAIQERFPSKGVTVLKGGDHGAKVAAERRFKSHDGPRVLISTAAGREGINLQHARVLFNFDLPWNPMDLEQRIGRIHRYGQRHTAQVYNLVLSDTIEGSIFLLLEEKLTAIARTLGKVDERGQVAEDLRSQILGQLSTQLNYASLYTAALNDPKLQRTRLELDAAITNANEARRVVFELFQDLDGFRLDDYKAMGSPEAGMAAIVEFLSQAAATEGSTFNTIDASTYRWIGPPASEEVQFTSDREASMNSEKLRLIGLDDPLVSKLLQKYRQIPAEEVGVRVTASTEPVGVLSFWEVEARTDTGQTQRSMVTLAIDANGQRILPWERRPDTVWILPDSKVEFTLPDIRFNLETQLHQELRHRGLIQETNDYNARLVGWLEVMT